MKIQTEYPFEDYVGYLVVNKEHRKNVCLVHRITKDRTTISYARYLVSVKEHRLLTKIEHVDHKDEDKTNDALSNLQILTKVENNAKSRKARNITRKYVSMICPACKEEFDRAQNKTHLGKKGKYTACSKMCSYTILKLSLSNIELENLGHKQLVKVYNK